MIKKSIKIILLLMLITVFAACGKTETASESKKESASEERKESREQEKESKYVDTTMTRIYQQTRVLLENDYLLFIMDPDTTRIEVIRKDTGESFESYIYTGATTGDGNVCIVRNIYDKEGYKDSYVYGSNIYELNGMYDIDVEDNRVTVHYSFAKNVNDYYIPYVIREEDFNSVTENMKAEDYENIRQFYKKLDINKLSAADEKNKDNLLKMYPLMASEVIYVLREGLRENQKQNLERKFKAAGYSYADYLRDEQLYVKEEVYRQRLCNIGMVFSLDGPDFIVEIPFSTIQIGEDFHISEIRALPSFGCKKEGFYRPFMFTEDGVVEYAAGSSFDKNVINSYVDEDAIKSKRIGITGRLYEESAVFCITEADVDVSTLAATNYDSAFKYLSTFSSLIINSDENRIPNIVAKQRYIFVDSGDIEDVVAAYEKYKKGR